MTTNIQRQDTAMGVIWILNTDDPDKFKLCNKCNAQFKGTGRRLFCPSKEIIMCHKCHLKECVLPMQVEHTHINISHIQKLRINKKI